MGYGFKGILWFVVSVAVALGSYMVTSYGAAERAKLTAVETSIVAARKEIRTLQTEFNARANMVQLGEWNEASLKLAAPVATAYLASENQLASIDSINTVAAKDAPAAVVPGGAPKALTQPAVQTASVGNDLDKAIARLGGNASPARAGGLAKARGTQTVAMLDDRLMDELKQGAKTEKSALR